MKRTTIHFTASRGMTLPELMVGLAVGLFVVTIAIATFVSTRTLNVVNSSSTRMTENARLATETLHTDLRSAGFAGCRTLSQRLDEKTINVVLNGGTDAGFISEGSSGVRGYAGVDTGHSPGLPSALADLVPAPMTSSDVVSVRVPADNVFMGVIEPVDPPTANPRLTALAPGNSIQRGDVVVLSDCTSATIFQVTAADPAATGVLEHAVNTLTPGNRELALYDKNLRPAFRNDSSVYRMQTRHYYVAPSVLRTGTNSLWRLTVPAPNGGALVPEEVASGIDRLFIRYGIDSDLANPEMNVDRYVSAQALGASAPEWDKVLSARVQLVAATSEDRMAQRAQTYQFAGSAVMATDRRLRAVFTEVVTLRNIAP